MHSDHIACSAHNAPLGICCIQVSAVVIPSIRPRPSDARRFGAMPHHQQEQTKLNNGNLPAIAASPQRTVHLMMDRNGLAPESRAKDN